MDLDYNTKYVIKNVGYFKNYIYTYNDYLINNKILNPELIYNQIGILYIIYKDKTETNLTGIIYFDFFNDYNDFITYVENNIKLKIGILSEKEKKNLLIAVKIWIHQEIYIARVKETAMKEFDKKLLKFEKVVNKLVDYKVNSSNGIIEYSRFLADKILVKELKPVLHIKIKDLELQEECLKHLLNLLTKKWIGVKADLFKFYFYKTIKLYQDNYEHNDAWYIDDTKKLKLNKFK